MTGTGNEAIDRAVVVRRLRDKTNLTLRECGEIVGRSSSWCAQQEREAEARA